MSLKNYSNKAVAQENLNNYLGYETPLMRSTRKDKKYMIRDDKNRIVHFGSMNPPMEDFTKHKDIKRRDRYLKRASNIKGDWKRNKYSPNNLSINVLWI
jgi:hypothetical protein